MTAVPAEAITAAAELLTRMKHAWLPADEVDKAKDRATVTKLLEAAAPHIEAAACAAERERIRRVIEEEYGPYAGRPMIRKLLLDMP